MPIDLAHVIDVIAEDARTGGVVLIMTESRPWDGSARRLFQLQEKINAYLSFALDGEMAESYPQFAGRPILLRLDCAEPLDRRTTQFIGAVRQQIAFQDIGFEIRITGTDASPAATRAVAVGEVDQNGAGGPCGTQCGCHRPAG